MTSTLRLSSLALLAMLATPGCANLLTIHKINIQQGNALTVEQLAEIREGMSRAELVQRVGAPVLEPTFNNDRWDYVYYMKEPDLRPARKTISVFFVGDQVSRVERRGS